MGTGGKKLPIRTVTMLKILSYLTTHERANKFRIRTEGETGTQPTTLNAIADLERDRLLKKETIRGKKARGGKPVELYGITGMGLIFLLHHIKVVERLHLTSFSYLVKNHRKLLPKVLGFWPLFEKVPGLEKIARRNLDWTVDTGYSWSGSIVWHGKDDRKTDTPESTFFRTILDPSLVQYPTGQRLSDWKQSEWKIWLQAAERDRKFRTEIISAIEDENRHWGSFILNWQKIIEDANEKKKQLQQLGSPTK
jgi:hypothetical protein